MNLLKWMVVFSVAFLTACILIFTFSQEPFRALVPARILVWRTPPVPIYAYVGGAFGVGLLLGLLMTLYNFIIHQTKMHKKNLTITDLEAQLSQAMQTLEINGLTAAGSNGALEKAGSPAVLSSEAANEQETPGGKA